MDEYESTYKPALQAAGLHSAYVQRPGKKRDGSAVAFNSRRFELLESRAIDFNALVPRGSTALDGSESEQGDGILRAGLLGSEAAGGGTAPTAPVSGAGRVGGGIGAAERAEGHGGLPVEAAAGTGTVAAATAESADNGASRAQEPMHNAASQEQGVSASSGGATVHPAAGGGGVITATSAELGSASTSAGIEVDASSKVSMSADVAALGDSRDMSDPRVRFKRDCVGVMVALRCIEGGEGEREGEGEAGRSDGTTAGEVGRNVGQGGGSEWRGEEENLSGEQAMMRGGEERGGGKCARDDLVLVASTHLYW